jgi:MoxR-like ATPase
MPGDILGTNIWNPQSGDFSLVKGPIFSQILLADEINRAPPKTQAALLQAMEERQVTIDGETYDLEQPFMVMATQNPIEQEGTYPLPEAQLDRFMFKLSTGYPDSLESETEILNRRIKFNVADLSQAAHAVFNQKSFVALQNLCRNEIHVDDSIVRYIAELVRATRDHENAAVGASPRGGVALLDAGKAMALIHGRDFVVPDDIKEIALDALSHRVILHTEVILDGVQEESVIIAALNEVPVPVSTGDGRYGAVAESRESLGAINGASSDDSGEEISEESPEEISDENAGESSEDQIEDSTDENIEESPEEDTEDKSS